MTQTSAAFTLSRALLQGSEDAGHMFQEHSVRAGQSGAARGPYEKLYTQVFFKFLDGTRKRRLLDMQSLGCTSEVEFLGHGQEATQMS